MNFRNNIFWKILNFNMIIWGLTCKKCGEMFDGYSGNMAELTCLTCVLKNEDPEVIKEDK